MRDDGIAPYMPDNPLPYLTDWLLEIGPTFPGANGMVPFEWSHIVDWSRLMGVSPTPWEARTLVQLSRAYAGQCIRAEKPDCPAPASSDEQTVAANRAAVSLKITSIFGGRG